LSEIQQIKQVMAGYYLELQQVPEKFSQIAIQVNEDSSRYVNGDLGWFTLGEMVPELELVLLNLQAGEISPVVQTRFGYHIVKLEEKIIDEKKQTTFRASHIFRKLPSFKDYLQAQVKQAKVVTLIKL